ncbi:MAG: DUF4397 domain-containing protein, partial [Chitinophagaceae bacterium]
RLFAVGMFSSAVVACSTDDGGYYYEAPQVAYGVIANASPDSGNLFFFADNNQVNQSGLSYTRAEGYYSFFPGNRVLKLKNEAGVELASDTISVAAGQAFSVFAVNRFEEIELVTYPDTLDYPAQNKARVRFINLTSDAPEVTVTQNTTVLANLSFKESSGFMDVETGAATVFTFSNDSDSETPYTLTAANLSPGHIYTIYTKGYVSPAAGSNDTFSTQTIRNY